ncbi:Smr/MutS family protein [Trinickia caryophylli]|uniref:DNA-nicking endonuclease, Smr domain n=1 Tax=Trinickia caryophylli TaxID=28094 RepID=A0A1X7CKK5_TRICW|nr:Smr/MutS family protein [Trinickia caryophylli]PMS09113.1 DNA mismatch repair protein MutS [Trinickia caryophylli]TRX19989.1 DNA mismatch repair protein MutS [Trinickia caryophylli]WQE12671.1 Smr/MutS family protein [Trinickia caryophylli]SME98036.1 DNA-nicking endonuclease, Smr domain [Trinickia caryophylli]GLU30374.1 DNA mismatch repair protein MutS [Trinickia caryophylli]
MSKHRTRPPGGKPAQAPARGPGLADLGSLRDALKASAAERERERIAAEKAAREAAAEAEIFRREIGDIAPLKSQARAAQGRQPPPALPLQTRRDEKAVLAEAISDEFDPEVLLDTDESLFYCRPGIGHEVVRKLRRGHWIVQAQLDLHGMRREEAREALAEFIRDTVKRGLRCVRVIHGKGLGSVGKEPVLKGKVRAWLVQKAEVIAFCQARERDGGAGAVLVLLQPGSPPGVAAHGERGPRRAP